MTRSTKPEPLIPAPRILTTPDPFAGLQSWAESPAPQKRPNPYELLQRGHKVLRMAAVLDALFGHLGASAMEQYRTVRGLDVETLRGVAQEAGVLPPSEETRIALVQLYWRRLRVVEEVAERLGGGR